MCPIATWEFFHFYCQSLARRTQEILVARQHSEIYFKMTNENKKKIIKTVNGNSYWNRMYFEWQLSRYKLAITSSAWTNFVNEFLTNYKTIDYANLKQREWDTHSSLMSKAKSHTKKKKNLEKNRFRAKDMPRRNHLWISNESQRRRWTICIEETSEQQHRRPNLCHTEHTDRYKQQQMCNTDPIVIPLSCTNLIYCTVFSPIFSLIYWDVTIVCCL